MPSDEQPLFSRRGLLAEAGIVTIGAMSSSLTSSVARSTPGGPVTTAAGGEVQTETTYNAYSESILESALETGRNVRKSVVALSRNSSGVEGTGWYVSDDVLVTAGHIVVIEPDWTAWQVDGTRVNTAYVDDAYLSGTDVGALRADEDGVPLSTGSTDDLELGQPLIEVGNPGGAGNWVISLGRYLGDTDGETNGFLTSAPARGGSSGSPVVTLDCTVVGLHSGRAELEDLAEAGPDTGGPAVYGPNDQTVRNEIVGIEAITEQVERWADV